LFEVGETTSQALARNLIQLLDQYGLKKNVITCVKDEGANLNVITLTLKCVVNCKLFGLEESFQGTCFDHVFSKAYQ